MNMVIGCIMTSVPAIFRSSLERMKSGFQLWSDIREVCMMRIFWKITHDHNFEWQSTDWKLWTLWLIEMIDFYMGQWSCVITSKIRLYMYKCVYKTDVDDRFALHPTAATVRQHMTQRHDHIVQAVMVVDGCDNFAIMTSGHILIAKRGLKSINLIQWHIILKARHSSTPLSHLWCCSIALYLLKLCRRHSSGKNKNTEFFFCCFMRFSNRLQYLYQCQSTKETYFVISWGVGLSMKQQIYVKRCIACCSEEKW